MYIIGKVAALVPDTNEMVIAPSDSTKQVSCTVSSNTVAQAPKSTELNTSFVQIPVTDVSVGDTVRVWVNDNDQFDPSPEAILITLLKKAEKPAKKTSLSEMDGDRPLTAGVLLEHYVSLDERERRRTRSAGERLDEASAEIDRLANQKMRGDSKLEYHHAVKLVCRENRALVRRRNLAARGA